MKGDVGNVKREVTLLEVVEYGGFVFRRHIKWRRRENDGKRTVVRQRHGYRLRFLRRLGQQHRIECDVTWLDSEIRKADARFEMKTRHSGDVFNVELKIR